MNIIMVAASIAATVMVHVITYADIRVTMRRMNENGSHRLKRSFIYDIKLILILAGVIAASLFQIYVCGRGITMSAILGIIITVLVFCLLMTSFVIKQLSYKVLILSTGIQLAIIGISSMI
jgi:hypothetical protein